MKVNTWEDHSEITLEGWIQMGNIHGVKYGTWVREINGSRQSITSSHDASAYWLNADNCFHGSHESPQTAATRANHLAHRGDQQQQEDADKS